MTIRQYMNRKKRRFFALAVSCFVPMLAGLALAAWSVAWIPLVFVPGFLGFIACILYAYTVGFACPRCRGPWHVLVLQTGLTPLSIDRRLRYCPYCGADIDAKGGADPKPEPAELLA